LPAHSLSSSTPSKSKMSASNFIAAVPAQRATP
jgi:hypothetical protein